MTLSLIVAMAENGVIGKDNKLPWHISEDLKRFKKITMGHPIIMGRKTFESISKPLPGRQNIVISRDGAYHAEGATVAHSLAEALASCPPGAGEKFVIGGAAVFSEAFPLADRLYLTLIHRAVPGNVFFPEPNWKKNFKITEQSEPAAAGELPYSFVTAERRR